MVCRNVGFDYLCSPISDDSEQKRVLEHHVKNKKK